VTQPIADPRPLTVGDERIVDVGPIADGQPATTSVAYSPPMMLLTMLLATVAGVLIVLGAAGLIRDRRARTPGSVPPAPAP